MSRQVRRSIHRLGKVVTVLERTETTTNEFNNPQSAYTDNGATSHCIRTYPNRNTQLDNQGGSYERDRPLFIFSKGEEPPTDARIIYEETTYEMQSPTIYDTHVAIFGKLVTEQ
jgi:hypothetical protein